MPSDVRWLVLLDRDGVININYGHVGQLERLEFVPGIFDFASTVMGYGARLAVVTNQSGIERGYYTVEDFLQLTATIDESMKQHGIKISKTYFCPHKPGPDSNPICECRKPQPGLLLRALEETNSDSHHAVMIGDSETDMVAAQRAGIRHRWFISDDQISKKATKRFKSVESLSEWASSQLGHFLS